jgi:hypothetical protein
VPKSRVRKKKIYTPPTGRRPAAAAASATTATARRRPSPRWVPVLAVIFFVIGIAWLVTYYMTQGTLPIQTITFWNLAIGFGMLVTGLGVLTQWR